MTEVIDESTDLHHQHGKPEGEEPERHGVTRRNVLRVGAVSIAAVGLGAGKVLMQPSLEARGFLNPNGLLSAASQAVADSLYIEAFPISPLILNPFNDPLLIPKALKPLSPAEVAALNPPPGPGVGQQNSFRKCCRSTRRASRPSRSTLMATRSQPERYGRCRPQRSMRSTGSSRVR
jgi:hypothetical protein